MRQPLFQERHHDYVLGPNQDSRLASVAAGAIIKGIDLELDPDAPFCLRGRALRQRYNTNLHMSGIEGLKTMWTGPNLNYRMQDFILESLQMANFGLAGNPKPIYPQIVYPAKSIIRVDLVNTSSSTLTNLTFYFRGVKLFPWGTVPGYTYPRRFAGLTFSNPFPPPTVTGQITTSIGVTQLKTDQIFTVGTDADFVLRALQCNPVRNSGGNRVAEVFFQLQDFNRKPYSNDLVHMDLFGSALGLNPVSPIPLGATFAPWYGPGPGRPGLFYPEIYVPKNHQLIYNLQRADSATGGTAAADVTFNFVGGKVFEQ